MSSVVEIFVPVFNVQVVLDSLVLKLLQMKWSVTQILC